MQNFEIKNKLLLHENKNEIKILWQNIFFDDDEKTIDSFLENVFCDKKGVGAFLNDKLIAMILFLNSEINTKNKKYKSVYFYAVCTDEKYRNKGIMRELFLFATEEAKKQGYEICFLVPENEELFKMYEKFSFERTINYEEKSIEKNEFDIKNSMIPRTDFCYSAYKRIKLTSLCNNQIVVWGKEEFEFIFNKDREDVSFLFTDFCFAVYEKNNEEILVYEICGDEKEIANLLFNRHNDCKKIILRVPVKTGGTDFGMTLNLVDMETEINSIYFGMPYG